MRTYFGYKFVQEIPLTRLDEFKEHRRLRVFYEKGCTCVNCGIVGTKLIQGDGRGNLHWDVYADCGMALTVDHILPRSKGGSDELSNLQPMCSLCNTIKGNGSIVSKGNSQYHLSVGHFCNYPPSCKKFIGISNPQVGMEIYKKKDARKMQYKGVISEILINPHTNKLSCKVEGKPDSMYDFRRLYTKKSP